MVGGFRWQIKQDRSEEWVHMRMIGLFSRIVAELPHLDKSGQTNRVRTKSVLGKTRRYAHKRLRWRETSVDIRLVQTKHDFNIAQYGVFGQSGNTLDLNCIRLDVHEFARILIIKMKMRFVVSVV